MLTEPESWLPCFDPLGKAGSHSSSSPDFFDPCTATKIPAPIAIEHPITIAITTPGSISDPLSAPLYQNRSLCANSPSSDRRPCAASPMCDNSDHGKHAQRTDTHKRTPRGPPHRRALHARSVQDPQAQTRAARRDPRIRNLPPRPRRVRTHQQRPPIARRVRVAAARATRAHQLLQIHAAQRERIPIHPTRRDQTPQALPSAQESQPQAHRRSCIIEQSRTQGADRCNDTLPDPSSSEPRSAARSSLRSPR